MVCIFDPQPSMPLELIQDICFLFSKIKDFLACGIDIQNYFELGNLFSLRIAYSHVSETNNSTFRCFWL